MPCSPRPFAGPSSLVLAALVSLGVALAACNSDSPKPPVCGNAVLEANEECEGSPVPRPGCSLEDCTIEEDYTCAPPADAEFEGEPPLGTVGNWTCEEIIYCGNGVIDRNKNEVCDDGNLELGDGCGGCLIEASWSCLGEPSVCEKCGNGFIRGQEQCDEGVDLADRIDSLGCSPTCDIVPGWHCDFPLGQCGPICGDGIWLDADVGNLPAGTAEQCDDGNLRDGDGCNGRCRIEDDWDCSLVRAPETSECVYAPDLSTSSSSGSGSDSESESESSSSSTTRDDTTTSDTITGDPDTSTTGGNPTTGATTGQSDTGDTSDTGG